MDERQRQYEIALRIGQVMTAIAAVKDCNNVKWLSVDAAHALSDAYQKLQDAKTFLEKECEYG
jgi:hypothetical protein